MSVLWNEEHSRQATRWAKPMFDLPRATRPADAHAQQAQLADVQEQARMQGFALGRAAGMADGRAEIERLRSRLQATLDALAKPMATVDAEVERVLVAVTLEAARRIAQQELHLEPAKVAAVVRDAVAGLGSSARAVAVFVNPDDYAALATALANEMQGGEGWRLVADPEVLGGGCRVESEQASVVSSLDARAAGLAHTLLANT